MKTQKFGPKDGAKFNTFWLALKDRGFRSRPFDSDLQPGEFYTRAAGAVYLVAWREMA